jgi:hypothetical protein
MQPKLSSPTLPLAGYILVFEQSVVPANLDCVSERKKIFMVTVRKMMRDLDQLHELPADGFALNRA